MLCQECNMRPATLHFTKIVNGEKTEFHICETCAKEKGEMIPGTPNGFSIHSLLSGMLDFDSSTKSQSPGHSGPQNLQCKDCGMTYAQFSKLGRFGCPSCYQYFDNRLDPLFKRVHGSTNHVGKVPVRTGGRLKVKRQIDDLKKRCNSTLYRKSLNQLLSLGIKSESLKKK